MEAHGFVMFFVPQNYMRYIANLEWGYFMPKLTLYPLLLLAAWKVPLTIYQTQVTLDDGQLSRFEVKFSRQIDFLTSWECFYIWTVHGSVYSFGLLRIGGKEQGYTPKAPVSIFITTPTSKSSNFKAQKETFKSSFYDISPLQPYNFFKKGSNQFIYYFLEGVEIFLLDLLSMCRVSARSTFFFTAGNRGL